MIRGRFFLWSIVVVCLASASAAVCCSQSRIRDESDSGADAACPGCTALIDAGREASCTACQDGRIILHDGWAIQASAKATGTGKEISTRGYATTDWVPVTVPTTVFAGLLANHLYPDPYIGDNLATTPPLPDGSWWYRTEFTLPPDYAGQAAWLDLDGINFKANVWLNGQRIASADDVMGTFTAYEWNVTGVARPGESNALAIEIFPANLDTDLTLTWLDWNPGPPDRDMGIWRDVYVKKSGLVALRDAHVVSKVDPSLAAAHLTVKAEARNLTAQALHATVKAVIDAIEVSQEIDLAPLEKKAITFEASKYPALDLQHPKLWWPSAMGAPDQYTAALRAEVGGVVSDKEAVRFGIRDVTFDLTSDGYRVFRINGKRLLIRGGGWASDMMLRASPERLEAELAYVKDLGLNTIRLEGKLETDDFYSRADDLGILTIPGWMCCDRWQFWDKWTPLDHRIATASMDAEAKRLRNHPSVIDFMIGSDEAPPVNVEQEFLDTLKSDDWPNPVSPSASNKTAAILGPSGVKMTGPYDWVAPSYWYLDTKAGGAFGFNTETGPGPAIPELESLKTILSQGELDDLWTKPDAKHFHAGTGGKQFDNLSLFNAALAGRHGAATSLEDYVRKAQLMNYEAERAPFEAYSRNKYAPATGVVHWLLNNAWPSLIWHLYGNDLTLSAAYFGAKKGNEAVHIQYSYDDNSVVVVNHTFQPQNGMQAAIRVYNMDGSQQFAQDAPVDVAEDAATKAITIPALAGASPTYFVKLTLTKAGQVVSSNFYWLSKRAEVVDFTKSDWYHAPTSQFADYTALGQLPSVSVQAAVSSEQKGVGGVTHVTLENTSSSVAFFVRLRLTAGKGGAEVTPVLWEDNYVSLMPGEKRSLSVTYGTANLHGAAPAVEIRGWNVAAQTLNGRARL
jgi:exo-1,4-beta-D-glucosaminidase